jgi:hypothetical protein
MTQSWLRCAEAPPESRPAFVTLKGAFLKASGSIHLRVILSNIGTFGDINPLIAIALELKRRGHTPVMAVPAVFERKIRPLGIEFRAVRPDIDPETPS